MQKMRLVPDIFFAFFKAFITFQTVVPEICSILILHKGLRLASPPHFVYDFSRKVLPMLYSIN